MYGDVLTMYGDVLTMYGDVLTMYGDVLPCMDKLTEDNNVARFFLLQVSL